MQYYKYKTKEGWTVTNDYKLIAKAKGRLIHIGTLTSSQIAKIEETEGYKVVSAKTSQKAVEVKENES